MMRDNDNERQLQEENQVLVNLVKLKDEEIMQLKRQLVNNSAMSHTSSPPRDNASPLRPRKQGSSSH